MENYSGYTNLSPRKECKRGDIYYIQYADNTIGSEQMSGRPGIIVSSPLGCKTSSLVTVVYLTTEEKTSSNVHVEINSAKKPSIALCEQINTISKNRLGDYYGTLKESELTKIDKALCNSLGINVIKELLINLDATENSLFDKCNKYILNIVEYAQQYKNLCDLIKTTSDITITVGNSQVNLSNLVDKDVLSEIKQTTINSLNEKRDKCKQDLTNLISGTKNEEQSKKQYNTLIEIIRDMVKEKASVEDIQKFMGYKTEASAKSFLIKNGIEIAG